MSLSAFHILQQPSTVLFPIFRGCSRVSDIYENIDASLSVVVRQILVFREIRIISEDELWFSDLGAGILDPRRPFSISRDNQKTWFRNWWCVLLFFKKGG